VSTYDAASIEQLEGLDAVRKRPGMYIGGTGSAGLHHLVWELVDNGVDEAAAGHADLIEVILHRDHSVEVTDNGRGIPIDTRSGETRSALEVVFTELHAGGKFGGGAYAASGGLHGVGASVVNALASKLVAEVDRDGATHRLAFDERVPGRFGARGGFKATSKVEKVAKVSPRKTGTRVRFWPDREIFDPEALIELATIRDHVARICFLVPGLKIRLDDKTTSPPTSEEFVAKGGLADYVEVLSKGVPVTDVIVLGGNGQFEEKIPVDGKMTMVERTCRVDVALRWNGGFDHVCESFVNTIPTAEGGTHVAGMERALGKVVNDLLLPNTKKLAKLARKNQARASRDDIQEGLAVALKVTFPEPQFRGQTKQELGTPAIQNIVYETVRNGLSDWIEESGKRKDVGALRDKVAGAVITRVEAKTALDARRKAQSLNSSGMPDKLADCRFHGIDSELLIVEGDSAAGPAKQGRNSDFMAVLPIRGKLVNAGKASLKQVVENAEAQAIFTAIGAGAGADCDLEQSRYGRIIILCDADVDGSHIRCLLLTLIYHQLSPLLEAGRVFAAMPPLFSTKYRGTVHYAYTDEERDAIADTYDIGLEKFVRFKGLGEMDVDELAETTLDVESRVLKRMTMSDGAEAASAADRFETLMGSDVARRKAFVLDNSTLVDPETLDV